MGWASPTFGAIAAAPRIALADRTRRVFRNIVCLLQGRCGFQCPFTWTIPRGLTRPKARRKPKSRIVAADLAFASSGCALSRKAAA
jgi:hypothetical protein